MTAPGSISQRDLELISSFLDGSLAPKERQDFLRRLREEPDLRREVAELRAVRQSLRDLPSLRVPRGFRLTREMVTPKTPVEPQRSRFYGWGSAAAVLALALLFFLDWGSSGWLAERSIPAALPLASDHATPGLAAPLIPAPLNPAARSAAPSPISTPLAAEQLAGASAPNPAQLSLTPPPVPPPAAGQLLGGGAPGPSSPGAPSLTPQLLGSQPRVQSLQPPAPAPAFKNQTNLPPPQGSSGSGWMAIFLSPHTLLRAGEILLALAAAGLALAAVLSRPAKQ